jgi:hypothetical protein
MKKLLCCTVLMVLLSLAGAQSLEAQRKGLGGILDFIGRLSGPRMVGPAATGWMALGEAEVLRVRVSAARRWSVHYEGAVLPEDESVDMWSLQPGLELKLADPFAVGAGVAVHRFSGDFADPFIHLSYPVYAQWRFPTGSPIQAVLSAGFHYWPAFDEGDFAPLETGVSTVSGEPTRWFGVGFEYVWD